MYYNLLAEIKRKGLRQIDVAALLDVSPSTLSQKLTCKTDFTLKEALNLKKILESETPLEELFRRDVRELQNKKVI